MQPLQTSRPHPAHSADSGIRSVLCSLELSQERACLQPHPRRNGQARSRNLITHVLVAIKIAAIPHARRLVVFRDW